jgi:predicted secreted hydrolase
MVGSGNVMVHNTAGYIGGETGWTYYYTEPNLETSGQLTLNGETTEVIGLSWMDHQWGEFIVTGYPSGWQWFGMQLPNNQYLMLSESRETDINRSTYATFRDSTGSTHHVSEEDIELITIDYWTSSKTNAVYPRKWILSIKTHQILIEIESTVAAQELTEAFPPRTIYWEGVATVSGVINGYYFTEKEGHRAFVELVGYVDTESIAIAKD